MAKVLQAVSRHPIWTVLILVGLVALALTLALALGDTSSAGGHANQYGVASLAGRFLRERRE